MSTLVISCEHARALVPAGVILGVSEEVTLSHVSWDPGAAGLAQTVASRLGLVAHLGRYSRLYVDLNRDETDAAVIPARAFGVDVPGNLRIASEDRQRRLAEHRSYREAVRLDVQAAADTAGGCLHLSMHSFTPRLGTRVRDFDVGILFDPARPTETTRAHFIIETLASVGLRVRANEPYAGTGAGMTTWLRTLHADAHYAGIEVEDSLALDAQVRGLIGDRLADYGSRLGST